MLVSLQVRSTIVLRSGPFQHRSPPVYSIFVCSALSHEPHSLQTFQPGVVVACVRACVRSAVSRAKRRGQQEEYPRRVCCCLTSLKGVSL